MKLFSRGKNPEAENDFDTIDLPTKEDLADSYFINDEAQDIDVGSELDYDIEDAIKLMRTLPRESSELVVMVVNKTLQSMNVAVADIVKSADDKEARLRTQYKALEKEVKELENKVAKHIEEMGKMQADLKETLEVKKRLQLALDIDKKLNQASKPAKVEVPTNTAVQGQEQTAPSPSEG